MKSVLMSDIQRYRQSAGENNDTMVKDDIGCWVLYSELHLHANRIFSERIQELYKEQNKAIEAEETRSHEFAQELSDALDQIARTEKENHRQKQTISDQSQEIERLKLGLKEALGWNWMDADAPDEIFHCLNELTK